MGFDPGVKTGVAVYRDGALVELFTVGPADYQSVLQDYQPRLVVFEDARLQSHIFTAPRSTGRAKAKIARNIGMIDGFCAQLEGHCKAMDIDLLGISPQQKGRKLKAGAFQLTTGWAGSSNQHTRDAAMVARRFRSGDQTFLTQGARRAN